MFGIWKPVKLEGGFLNENLTDLIGIEELTDYQLFDFKTKVSTEITFFVYVL